MFRNADNNNRESTYNQLSPAILTPTSLVLGYILVLETPLVPAGIHVPARQNVLLKLRSTLEQAMKAQRGSKSIALLFL
jgi:hypothetical protein